MQTDVDESIRQLQIEVYALRMIIVPGLARLAMQVGDLDQYLAELKADAAESAAHFQFRNVPEADQDQLREQIREKAVQILGQLEPQAK